MYDLITEVAGYLHNVHSGSQFVKLTQSLSPKQKRILDNVLEDGSADNVVFQNIYDGNPERQAAYEKAKQRLYYKLIQSFFLPKQSRPASGFDFYRNKSIEYTALAKIMSATPCRLSIEHLVRVGLKFSKKAEVTENTLELLKIKLNLLGTVKQDNYIFNKTYAQYSKYKNLHDEESEFQIKYYEIYSKSKSNRSFIQLDEQFINRLNQNIKSQKSLKLTLFSYQTMSILYERNHQYQELFDLSKEALAYVESRPLDSTRLRNHFIRRKYTCCLKLKKYEELSRIFHEYFGQIPKYSHDWFLIKSYDTMLLLHDKKYEDASSNLPNAAAYAKGVSENIVELYILVRGYAKVIYNIAVELNETNPTKFRIFKLLNQLPIHSQEKAGPNIAILILQIVHAVDNRKYDHIIDRVDALKQYQHRHLKKKKSFRSYCFVKMIIEMTKADFHPIRTERYTKDLLGKLNSVPLELSEQPLEVEIVPYEDLWEMIIKLLERNSKIKRGRPSKKSLKA